MTYTERIGMGVLEDLPAVFGLSFCQTEIEKLFDIRVFYLAGHCYSMAILSQELETTSVDFRKYNFDNPNRSVPYVLPQEICLKIIMLMNELELVSASVDLILNKQREYIFLEVNPVGQFGMVEFPCNYGLNELIARYLIYGNENEGQDSK